MSAENINDIKLEQHDLSRDALHQAVRLSLMLDRHAAIDDTLPTPSENRRGWWADPYSDEPAGSKLWLLSREKQTTHVLQRAREYARQALNWLLEDGVAKQLSVEPNWVARGFLQLRVLLTLPDDSPFAVTVGYTVEVA